MLHNATMYQMIKKGCDNLVIKKIEYLSGKERALSINGCKWTNEENIDYQHKETSYLDDTIYEIKINFLENRIV